MRVRSFCLLLGLLLVGVVVVLVGFGDQGAVNRAVREVRMGRQSVSVKVTKRSLSYDVESEVSCWSLDCNLENNYHAKKTCGHDDASSEWNLLGVEAMDRYIQGDHIYDEVDYSNRFLKDASTYFINAVVADPTCARIHANLALVYLEMNSLKSALHHISTAIQLNTFEPRYYVMRSFIYELLHKEPERIKDRDTAVQIDPFICERKYFGILLCNTTNIQDYSRWPQIVQFSPTVERVAAQKFLIYIEFASVSIANYAITTVDNVDFFIANKYIILRKIIPPFVLRPVQNCYRSFIKSGIIQLQTAQSLRYITQSDRCGRLVLFNLVDLVRKSIAHNARPSYSYFGGYVNSSVLAPHTDRKACEFTFSITLQQNPFDQPWGLGINRIPKFERSEFDSGVEETWPTKEDTIYAYLNEGDGLLFMGRHLVHFREGPLEGEHRWVNQLFLHHVQEKFVGGLD